MISGRHFVIRRAGGKGDDDGEEADAEAMLEDCSTNGTMLNNSELVKQKSVPLKDGDTISVVFGKASLGQKNCGFVFRFISPSSTSTSTEDEDDELEETQTLDQDALLSSLERSKDGAATTTSSGGSAKRPREDDDDENDGQTTNKRSNAASTSSTNAAPPPPPPPQDDMEENMMCCICQDILHDCVSVQPCMHCFCGGCYSGWMKQSKLCPQCRKSVQHVAKNHTVNNLVNAYLKMHPEKCRDKEDLDELDKKNAIKDGLKDGKSKSVNQLRYNLRSSDRRRDDDDDDEDDEENSQSFEDDEFNSDEDRSDDYDDGTFRSNSFPRLPRVRCQQCVGGPPASVPLSVPAPRPPPTHQCDPQQLHINCLCCSVPMPDRRFQPLSDSFPLERRQCCALCSNVYCHSYFGCSRCDLGCLTKLRDTRFGDNEMHRVVLDIECETRILMNYLTAKGMTKEEMFVKCVDNLDSGRYSVTDELLRPTWGGGNAGTSSSFPFSSSSTAGILPGHVTSSAAFKSDCLVCRACALKVMKELIYQFREKEVDKSDLPPAIAARPDCWWGRNCRTAICKSAHAEKLNHICQQTRRT